MADSSPGSDDLAEKNGNATIQEGEKEKKRRKKRTRLSLYRARDPSRPHRPRSPDKYPQGREHFPIEQLAHPPKKERGHDIITHPPTRTKRLLHFGDKAESTGTVTEELQLEELDEPQVQEESFPKRRRIIASEPSSDEATAAPVSDNSGDSPTDDEDGGPTARIVEELKSMMPHIVEVMENAGVLHEYVMFHHLLKEGRYPLDNIALLLWLETVRWYSLSSTTAMFYWSSTLKFWECGYSLFHGKFLRFLSGPKSLGQQVAGETERGFYTPEASEINFAVPDVSIIRKSSSASDLPKNLKPGIIQKSLDVVSASKHGIPHVLSIDGKKVASGLSDESGDVDLFGHEDGSTHEQRLQRLQEDIAVVDSALDLVQKYGDNLQEFPTPIAIVPMIKEIIKRLSLRIKDLRQLKIKQDASLKKFKSLGGEDWRSSKYVFAISGIQCQLFKINSGVTQALDCIRKLCLVGCRVYGTDHHVVDGSTTQCHLQRNMVHLKEPIDLPPNTKDSSFIKQRTPEWFDIRAQAPVSGSTFHKAIGGGTLKEQQEHFDVKIRKMAPKPFTAEQEKFIKHGVENEDNALLTLASQVLPLYFPGHCYVEEGVYVLTQGDKPLIAVSPDGSLRKCDLKELSVGSPDAGIEVKCPYPNEYTTPVHYQMPARYIPQVLSEMAALGVQKLIYASYSSQSTTVFEVSFDHELMELMVKEAQSMYLAECPRRPGSTSTFSKLFKTVHQDRFLKEKVEFLAEVPSVKSDQSCRLAVDNDTSAYLFSWNCQQEPTRTGDIDAKEVLSDALKTMNECYQVCRLKGTEVLVFMLSDVNRSWHKEVPHAIPIAFGLKGYSLTTDAVRKLIETVLQACYEKKIYVPCVSFDGQWASVMNRDASGKPLTRLQLQKDIWSEAKGTPKPTILHDIKQVGFVDTKKALDEQVHLEKLDTGAIAVSSTDPRFASVQTPSSRSLWSTKKVSRDAEATVMPVAAGVGEVEWLPDDVLDEVDAVDIVAQTSAQCTDQHQEVIQEPSEEADDLHVEADDIDLEAEGVLPDLPPVQVETMPTAADNDTPRISVPDEHCLEILGGWRNLHASKGKTKEKWSTAGIWDVKDTFRSAKTLNKLLIPELDIILAVITPLHQEQYKKSWPKWKKVNFLSDLIGDRKVLEQPQKRTQGKVSSLRDIAMRILSGGKYPKAVLNSVYAKAILCPSKCQEWEFHSLEIEGLDRDLTFFYHPEFSTSRNQLEVKVLDGHHLLVNLRVKVCKDGLPGYSVAKEAWYAVAEKSPDIISKALVCDLVDRQSGAFARRTFSAEVEREMIALGFTREAKFVQLIRNWYDAEDQPGMPALERTVHRLALRDFLLEGVDFQAFPPPGTHVNGMSSVMFEGFLASIDAHLLLYTLCRMPYNQRAIGSQDVEGFFSELTEMEPTKLGCPKGINIGRLMSTATRLLQYRCDPSSRTFSMWTTRNPTYPVKSLIPDVPSADEADSACGLQEIGHTLQIKDHFFDTKERRRTKRTTKRGDVSKPDAPSRGEVGVRQFHKRDESKILPTTRLGMTLLDN